MSALLYFITPSSMIISRNALHVKMSIIKFNRQVKRGMPEYLTEEEQMRWLTRAYLLNKSKSRLLRIKGMLPSSLPFTIFFAMTYDPFHFVKSTWGRSRVFASRGSGDGHYGSTGGGYSGGDGGGGAGAR